MNDKSNIGKPQNDPAVTAAFKLKIGEESFVVTKPLIYKWTDHVKGELWRPVEVVPPLSVEMIEKVLMFSDDQPRDVNVRVKSSSGKGMKGTLKLQLPPDWHSEPLSTDFELKRGEKNEC